MDKPRDRPLWGVGPWTSACLAERQVQGLREKRASGGLTARPRTDREGGYKEACDRERLVGQVQCRPCLCLGYRPLSSISACPAPHFLVLTPAIGRLATKAGSALRGHLCPCCVLIRVYFSCLGSSRGGDVSTGGKGRPWPHVLQNWRPCSMLCGASWWHGIWGRVGQAE